MCATVITYSPLLLKTTRRMTASTLVMLVYHGLLPDSYSVVERQKQILCREPTSLPGAVIIVVLSLLGARSAYYFDYYSRLLSPAVPLPLPSVRLYFARRRANDPHLSAHGPDHYYLPGHGILFFHRAGSYPSRRYASPSICHSLLSASFRLVTFHSLYCVPISVACQDPYGPIPI